MMKNPPSISTLIFDELFSTLEVLGIDKTIKTLKDAKASNLLLNDMSIDFILNSVSEVTGVSKERIINGKDRNDDRKIAISLCVFYIKEEFGYTYSEIVNIFNVGVSALSRYNTIVENTPKQAKTDFDKKINDYIKKLNIIFTEKKLKDGKI